MMEERTQLEKLVAVFREKTDTLRLCPSVTSIQGVIIPGNEEVKSAEKCLQENGFDVRAILYPSVPKGEERLRVVLHSFNTTEEVQRLVNLLQNS
jgi:8-amino-7-oxononanoate synthase